eukprot:gene6834-9507_t
MSCKECARKSLGASEFDLSVSFVTKEHIRSINRTYRGVDEATDILSFPFHEFDIPGKTPVSLIDDEKDLGDIYLSIDIIKQQQRSSLSIEDEIKMAMMEGKILRECSCIPAAASLIDRSSR